MGYMGVTTKTKFLGGSGVGECDLFGKPKGISVDIGLG